MALDIATLQSRIGELEQRLGQKDAHIEALKAEVLRLRRWRFGRSAETLDPGVAPELALAGGEISTTASLAPPSDATQIARLVSVHAPRPTRRSRRPAREPPANLPSLLRVHGAVHGLSTGFLAAANTPEAPGHLRGVAIEALRLLAAWDLGTGGVPVPFADRVAGLPSATPDAGSAAHGDPRDP